MKAVSIVALPVYGDSKLDGEQPSESVLADMADDLSDLLNSPWFTFDA